MKTNFLLLLVIHFAVLGLDAQVAPAADANLTSLETPLLQWIQQPTAAKKSAGHVGASPGVLPGIAATTATCARDTLAFPLNRSQNNSFRGWLLATNQTITAWGQYYEAGPNGVTVYGVRAPLYVELGGTSVTTQVTAELYAASATVPHIPVGAPNPTPLASASLTIDTTNPGVIEQLYKFFTFPTPVTIPSGGYLVVIRNNTNIATAQAVVISNQNADGDGRGESLAVVENTGVPAGWRSASEFVDGSVPPVPLDFDILIDPILEYNVTNDASLSDNALCTAGETVTVTHIPDGNHVNRYHNRVEFLRLYGNAAPNPAYLDTLYQYNFAGNGFDFGDLDSSFTFPTAGPSDVVVGSFTAQWEGNKACIIRDTLLLGGPPAAPTFDQLEDTVCANGSNFVVSVNDLGFTYTWTAGGFVNFVAGQGNESASFNIATTGTGTISVTPDDNGCIGTPATVTVVGAAPVTGAPVVSGPASLCENGTGVYTVTGVSNANEYLWDVPAGWSIVSGDGTATVTVSAGTSAGNVSVLPRNTYCNGPFGSQLVSIAGSIGATGSITGNAVACAGASENYSVGTVTGATTYTWTVPAGWNITAGQGTNQITVTVGATPGTLTVTPSSAACDGTPASLTTTAGTLPTAGFLFDASGNTLTFTNTSQNATGATYAWDFGDGNTSTLENPTHTYTDAGNFTIQLIVSTPCGSDTTTQTFATSARLALAALETVVVFPNPTTGRLNVRFERNPGRGTVTAVNLTGQAVKTWPLGNGLAQQFDVADLVSGVYLLQVSGETARGIARFVVE